MGSIDKKIRIQLYDTDFNMLEDRLVSQGPELLNGPKQAHTGPMKVEVSLFERGDVDNFIEYLQRLVGDLPLESKTKKHKLVAPEEIDDDYRIKLLDEALESNTNQQELIKYLRARSFKFVTTEYLRDLGHDFIKEKHADYQWMILSIKEGKDLTNDKFDPKLAFGIKYMGQHKDRILIYLFGEFNKSVSMEVGEEKFLIKTTDMAVYPPYLTAEERLKWGKEHRLLLNDPTRNPSKFYVRWMNDIQVTNRPAQVALPE